MTEVIVTENLLRHVDCPRLEGRGQTVRAVLDSALAEHSTLRRYILDDQGRLRRHMMIFVDGRPIADRFMLSDSIPESGIVHVMQALSGG